MTIGSERGVRRAVAVAACMVSAGAAAGQLTPSRLYYGVGRAIPVTVRLPRAADDGRGGAPGAAEVRLIDPASGETVGRAAVPSGGAAAAGLHDGVDAGGEGGGRAVAVDLASLFPRLWSDPSPRVLYAQLAVAGGVAAEGPGDGGWKGLGPPVVVQPMVTPATPETDQRVDPRFPAEAARRRVVSGVRVYVDRRVLLETSAGPIEVALRPDAAPNTAWNFRTLVEGGFYTDVVFHRIVAKPGAVTDFLVQTGDPTGTGSGGPGYAIDLERSTLAHDYGVVSMARGAREPNSAGSQFFIALSREGSRALDGKYASFGQVVSGAAVLDAIARSRVGAGDRPEDPPPRIVSARLVEAPPFGEGPGPVGARGEGGVER